MNQYDPDALAAQWAADLPRAFAKKLAAALRVGYPALEMLKAEVAQAASLNAVSTAMVLTKKGDGPYAGGVLTGLLAARATQPTIQSVWTGPESQVKHTRLTLAVVADLVDEAKSELIMVSYAAYPDERLRDSLHDAVKRGVTVVLLLERPEDNPGFTGPSDPFPGLAATRLSWPASSRAAGKTSMHAKVLVVDRVAALVGSANLTGAALERNLECGVLIRGEGVPGDLALHLLTAAGLQKVS